MSKTESSGTTQYSWDFEGRLTLVTLPGSGGTVIYKYDPFGRRIYKSSNSGTRIFAYDDDDLIEETDSNGIVVARYSHGPNIDEPLAMLRSSTTSYYQSDGLGSITSLSNSAGSLAQTYSYDSFGKQTNSSGSVINPFQYTARELDSEPGLYYYRARYYDPKNGRFLSEDRMGFDAGANFYTYVDSDPNDFADPFGNTQQKPFCCKVKLPSDPDAALLSQLIFAEGTTGDGISAENSDKEMLAIAFSAINRVDYMLNHPKDRGVFGPNSTPSIAGVLVPDQYGAVRRRRFGRPKHPSNLAPADCDFLARSIQAANKSLGDPTADPFDGTFGFRTIGRGGNGGDFYFFPVQIPGSKNQFFGLNR